MSSKRLLKELQTEGGYGLIQVFTGDGKGKTTAALGEAMRAVGAGKKVAVVFFDKGGGNYSERGALDRLGIDWWACGRDRIDPKTGRFDFGITDLDKQEAARAFSIVVGLFEKAEYDLVVLDEINVVVSKNILELDHVVSVIKNKPKNTELVLTGRGAPEKIIDLAHLVTETKLKKHYFYSGVKAREGLDY